MTQALHEIIIRAPSISHEAMKALHAPDATRQMRYNVIMYHALRDPGAQWTEEERTALMALYEELDENRSEIIPFRATPTERAMIEQRAAEADMTLSEYVRRRALD